MMLANQNANLTRPDQGFLLSRLVLTLKPWERGCQRIYSEIRGVIRFYICCETLLYMLRNSNPPAPLIFTKRFRNFVTIKYYNWGGGHPIIRNFTITDYFQTIEY